MNARRIGMLRGASAFLLSFAGERPGALAWVARGIGEHLRREATAAALGPVEAAYTNLGNTGAALLDALERAQRRRTES